MNDELNKLERVSDWYVSEQVDFDKRLIEFRYRTWKQRLVGPKGLELGPAEGVMTKFLLDDFESLTVVDAASNLLNRIPDADNLVKIHSLFEDFDPEEKFNSIIMEHILEHVDDPTMLLKRAKDWLLPGGKLYLGVPNGTSFHR
jgi:2-polyprenyl-3-methyl-5-hydroxy-6-metoxy-1,4-benzoquinol methylase